LWIEDLLVRISAGWKDNLIGFVNFSSIPILLKHESLILTVISILNPDNPARANQKANPPNDLG
jgi:hypothetical protein